MTNAIFLALNFAPRISGFVVEILSNIFGTIPDEVLFPWLPGLIVQLREHRQILQPLIKEAAAIYPRSLAEVERWKPPWLDQEKVLPKDSARKPTSEPAVSPEEISMRNLLLNAPKTAKAMAGLIGIADGEWAKPTIVDAEPSGGVQ